MKRLAVIGSTGSIGQNTLRVVEHLPDRFKVFALAANSTAGLLAEQAAAFRPAVVAISDAGRVDEFQQRCRELKIAIPEVVTGAAGLRQVASAAEVDIVISAAVGAAGVHPTYSAVASGKTVALANKEAMVIAGELLRKTAARSGSQIIPVDSEHSAVDQCLRSGHRAEVRRLILTASGGPFRDTPAEKFPSITPEEALKHPTWQMGRRITIDSATLMNKGLEVIEARWLFDIPPDKIDIMVHPQSVMHSMVEFVDGSIVGQLGTADMRQPIQYALTYPERVSSPVPPLDWTQVPRLDFMPPDRKKFPCISLAYRAIEMGGTAPAVLNAADEIAVQAFLNRRIPFSDIPKLIAATLEAHHLKEADHLDAIIEADAWARKHACYMLELEEGPSRVKHTNDR
jgi:1-deoxy-D-xylulose-5-phosphate reductoisomerase